MKLYVFALALILGLLAATGSTPSVAHAQPAGAPPPAAVATTAPAAAAPPAEATWWEKKAAQPYVYEGTYWLPPAASKDAKGPDDLFIWVLGLSFFFFFAILIVVVYFVIKYRHKPGRKPEPSAAHNDVLEITWTVIPTIICVLLFVYGWRSYISLT
ncbi:MAG TPA: cytochrome c oxidase subunit II transmembrane domain-containing protein, partial [Kofleriaceae bacterium]|nr:cytochrome c oxidase subunit II transmembrane domain-containing protein [Kofleriaceae bacterium]